MELPQRVYDLSDRYANFMKTPRSGPSGPQLCSVCRTLVSGDWGRCYRCNEVWKQLPGDFDLDVVVPITYSPALGQMHTALRGYKDAWGGDDSGRNRLTLQLAAVLHRFLALHEPCVAAAAGVGEFDLVTNVPSGTRERDDDRGRLRRILGRTSSITSPRYERVLAPTNSELPKHQYDPKRFVADERASGRRVLLIDDTWTTGSSAQSAAHALKQAGAETVGTVVIGRHIDPEWMVGDASATAILERLPLWDWRTCAVHLED